MSDLDIRAATLAACAQFLLYRLMAARVPAKASVPTAKVILAGRNLELGAMIKDSDLKAGDWSGFGAELDALRPLLEALGRSPDGR